MGYPKSDTSSTTRRADYEALTFGATAATFATTLAGGEVRYVLVLDTDCNRARCRPPVEELDVSLDNDLVLHTDLDTKARHDIALNAMRADENQITVTAAVTAAGTAVRIHILALHTPARTPPQRQGGGAGRGRP